METQKRAIQTEASAVVPWIGDTYSTRPIKILVVGESAYSTDDWNWSPLANQELIEDQIVRNPERAIREMGRVVSGHADPVPADFWRTVAFANLICCDIGIGNRRPLSKHWTYSKPLFRKLMDDLECSPTHIVVFGSATWKNMPPEQFGRDLVLQAYRFRKSKCAIATYVNHPSAKRHGKFILEHAQQHVADFLKLSFDTIDWSAT